MSTVWLSLLIGFVAWGFGWLAYVRKSAGWMFASFSLCCVAAVLPFYEIQWRFDVNDVSGAMDVIGGIIFGEIVLVAVTILINAAALYRMKKK